MDWLHCNNCFFQSKSFERYYMSSCGHIFCDKCFQSLTKICIVCKANCTYISFASESLPDQLNIIKQTPIQMISNSFQNLFNSNLVEAQKYATNSLKQIKTALNMHSSQYRMLQKTIHAKIKMQKDRLDQIQKETKAINDEVEDLKRKNEFIKKVEMMKKEAFSNKKILNENSQVFQIYSNSDSCATSPLHKIQNFGFSFGNENAKRGEMAPRLFQSFINSAKTPHMDADFNFENHLNHSREKVQPNSPYNFSQNNKPSNEKTTSKYFSSDEISLNLKAKRESSKFNYMNRPLLSKEPCLFGAQSNSEVSNINSTRRTPLTDFNTSNIQEKKNDPIESKLYKTNITFTKEDK